MSRLKRRVVQTELDLDDYEALAALARRKNLTIKEAAREALRWWNASNADLADDPLFKLVPVRFKSKIRSEEIDSFLYGKRLA
jgi:hypothetical protein